MTRDDIRAESAGLLMARRSGLVECPHCHDLVDPDALGATCDICGAEGCDNCIALDMDTQQMVCSDPFDSGCPGATAKEDA